MIQLLDETNDGIQLLTMCAAFMRSALACAAIHYAQPLFDNIGIGGGCTLLAGLTAVCAASMTMLWYYGPRLRAKSKFAETY